jgi:hypothetical protein
MNKLQICFLFITLVSTNLVYSKGGRYISPEEYRKLPGENNTIKIGDKWAVPWMLGRNIDEDPKAVERALRNFKLSKITRVNDSKPKGAIISQSPKENSLVDTVGSIDILVSDGPKN